MTRPTLAIPSELVVTVTCYHCTKPVEATLRRNAADGTISLPLDVVVRACPCQAPSEADLYSVARCADAVVQSARYTGMTSFVVNMVQWETLVAALRASGVYGVNG